tara:strand:+ start:507 stop:680 length:174 start_codon:yes stop_codon:yes gene_type:complete
MKRFREQLDDPNDKYTVRCQKCHSEDVKTTYAYVLVCNDCGYIEDEQEQEQEPEQEY